MRPITKKERGQALIEMALVLPILLALVFGIIEFGNIYSTQLQLNNVARQAVRTAVVGLPADDEGVDGVEGDMERMAEDLGLNKTKVDITRPGGDVKATVVYDCPLITGQIIGLGPKHLTAEATMKAEG